MRLAFVVASALVAFAPCAFAQDSGREAVRDGADSIAAGASVAGGGLGELASGNVAAGAVSIPLGVTSAAAGSAVVAGGAGSAAVEGSAQSASAAVDNLFDRPVRVTDVTVVAQPAPAVPFDAQKGNAGGAQ